MAAFSYHQELPPFLVDCALTPDMIIKLTSSSSSSSSSSPTLSPSSCCFSGDHLNPNYPLPIFHGDHLPFQYSYESLVNFHQDHLDPVAGFGIHEGTPLPLLAHHTTPACSDSEACVTPKQAALSGGGGAKKKPRGDASKDVRGGRGKKQKKSNNNNNNEGVKKEVEQTKASPPPPPPPQSQEPPKGYIHVRARRGQATDSHSLAERVRREKISERMKLLQSLVPGCDKVTGKAIMLDEIINYVQSLQSQVEYLSTKLSTVNPMVYNFGVDLDALLLGQQALNNAANPLPSVQQCSQSTSNPTTEAPPTGLGTVAATTGMATVFQQEEERGAPCLQENSIGSLYWGVVDHQGGFANHTNNINTIMY